MTAVVLVVKIVVASALSVGALSVAANHDLFTAVNTALNFASWWLLITQQRKLRNEVTPKLNKVEDVATQIEEQVLSSPVPGGKRKTDPPVSKTSK